MRDPDAPDGRNRQVGELFGRLRETGPEGDDSERMWRRIEASLPRRRTLGERIAAALAGWSPNPAWRFATVLTAALLVGALGAGIVLWTSPAPPGEAVTDAGSGEVAPGDADRRLVAEGRAADGELVLLTPPGLVAADGAEPDADPAPGSSGADPAPGPEVVTDAADAESPAPGWEIDVRLVRGYDGAPPPDAVAGEMTGAGGASRLQDLRSTLRALLPFGDYALVGQWTGSVAADGAVAGTDLSGSHRLDFRARPDAQGDRLRLEDVRLTGAGEPRLAGPMALLPDQLYLLGVRGADGSSSLVLAVRARRVPGAEGADGPRD